VVRTFCKKNLQIGCSVVLPSICYNKVCRRSWDFLTMSSITWMTRRLIHYLFVVINVMQGFWRRIETLWARICCKWFRRLPSSSSPACSKKTSPPYVNILLLSFGCCASGRIVAVFMFGLRIPPDDSRQPTAAVLATDKSSTFLPPVTNGLNRELLPIQSDIY